MLEATQKSQSPFPRLYVRGAPSTAWIERRPGHQGGPDWELWIERNGTLTRAKCPMRLEIESRLRSWVLRQCRVPLYTLSYEELRLIAEGKIREARRAHVHGLDTLMHRPNTPPIPYAST